MSQQTQPTEVELAHKLIAEKEAEIKNLKDQVAGLEAQTAGQKSEITTKDAQIAGKDAELKEAEGLIIEMQAELSKKDSETSAAGDIIVSHDKKKYRVTSPKFIFKGTEYTAAELKTNKELVSGLIAKSSSVLEAV